jgi:FkbM family methyltransferase
MFNKSKLIYYSQRAIELLLNPYALYVKSKGGIADLHIRLNKPWFYDLQIDTVLDIGGNIGQFSKTMRFMLPNAQIYAFEPLPSCYKIMSNLMQGDTKYLGFNCGLGEKGETLSIVENSHAPSSSFLPLADKHKEAFPFTSEQQQIQVPVRRLDELAQELNLGKSILIKVDVQGFEDKVVKGGLETFGKAKVLIMELSYQELYKNQPLFNEIYQELTKLGFKFYGTMEQLTDPKNKSFLDADCIFIKNNF